MVLLDFRRFYGNCPQPHFWKNRSISKWDFLKTLTSEQREKLANKIRNDKALTGVKVGDHIFKYVSDYERQTAERDIDSWLSSGYDGIIVGLAGQPALHIKAFLHTNSITCT